MKNDVCLALSAAVFSLLCGCASHSPKMLEESQACMHYRAMMTAPMPPDAMQQLKQACEDAQSQDRAVR